MRNAGIALRDQGIDNGPGAWTVAGELRLKLGPVSIDTEGPDALCPGQIHVNRHHVWVGTGTHPVRLGHIQAPGKKLMDAAEWARGARLSPAVRAS